MTYLLWRSLEEGCALSVPLINMGRDMLTSLQAIVSDGVISISQKFDILNSLI
jgi:hypothetical protein